jgi:predicted O-methyltransferase YrrM
MYQDPRELERLLEIFRTLNPRTVLEIGSMYGGTLWHWTQNMKRNGLVVSVDTIVPNNDHRYDAVMAGRMLWTEWENATEVQITSITTDSTKPSTIEVVAWYGPFDFIFIDGGHDYNTVNSDFVNYWPMLKPGGVMAFHDIAYANTNRDGVEVGRWWRELVASGQYKTGEIIQTPDVWGIGVIYREA